ncbi:MAG TPA: HPr family phosphocarrier protein [Candidatus Faeciplasma gallinarum]|uniref:HPr family phosphocarrier protein n=1 Tax=Candidatus Faeciplasma gallinarum TaxID=2840799 RepID=A0A9D1EMV2_9FIRM|nr:HPr family phosphocarrier protein [Candidatus Faeciplasma gallinarum]
MNKFLIKLDTINDVKEFVNIISLCDYDVDLVSGRYSIDAKSIMGIFSLDLSRPVELQAHVDDCSELKKKLDRFLVK